MYIYVSVALRNNQPSHGQTFSQYHICSSMYNSLCKYKVLLFYLNHYNWSTISIDIWLNVGEQNAHPAIHRGNILYVNN